MCFHYQDKDHSYNLRVTIMKQRSFLSILCFVLLSIVLASISAQTCIENRKNFIPNGTYDENRRHILSFLPSNVTARDGLFYNASSGQEPNRVYAVGMCIPRADANDCSDCIKGVSDWLIQSCPNQTDAYYWGLDPTLCLVRYSNTSFTGSAAFWETTPQYLVYNTADIPTSNLTEFTAVWEDLMNRTIAEASATSITPSSSDNHYKVGSAPWINFQMIYVLMQCTPDISPGDCNYCLRQSVTDYQACCMHNTGGYVMRPICFFRWQFFTFSKAFGNIMSAPPLSSPSLQIPVVPQPPTSTSGIGSRKNSLRPIVKIVVPVVVGVFIIIIIILVLLARRSAILFWKRKPNQEIDLDQSGITTVHSLQFDFKTIEAATEKFAINNKLGEGGFGEVFKGTLPNGTEVAVKRLSKKSSQGAHEFKNEVVVVAKLQHRNLVRLLGFCLEGEEKILVYEFVQHKSLDYFLFDTTKQGQLDWPKRYIIIVGITRGILYLHQDSRLTIIHRDLKASNILLDANMIPKIADFGMAKIFGIDQSGANTNRIVGTRGYMSPEYVTEGLFSTKSDVYSFGVLALEIICGRKNRFVHQSDTIVENLVTYAWKLWRRGTPLDLVDPTISENCQTEEVTRCIHIALLCVQDDPADRPSLSTINIMLTSNTIVLPDPQQPGFFFPSRRNQERDGHESSHSTTVKSNSQSINDVTITDLDPR